MDAILPDQGLWLDSSLQFAVASPNMLAYGFACKQKYTAQCRLWGSIPGP